MNINKLLMNTGERCHRVRGMPDSILPSAEPVVPRRWLIAPLGLLAALLAMETTGIDRAVSHWVYDQGTHAFPLRSSFLFETILHRWAKYSVILGTSVIAAAFVFTYFVPVLHRQRRLLLFLVLAMTLAPLSVTGLKDITDRPCPWDLADYGGGVPYTHLFETRERPHARGMCFPAGHASTGFALMAFFFAAHRERRFALKRAALLAGALAGFVLGMGRVVQGAHFVSHVLWSGLVCWLVMVGLYALLFSRQAWPALESGEPCNQLI